MSAFYVPPAPKVQRKTVYPAQMIDLLHRTVQANNLPLFNKTLLKLEASKKEHWWAISHQTFTLKQPNNIPSHVPLSALQICAITGNVESLLSLLEQGAPPKASNPQQNSWLHQLVISPQTHTLLSSGYYQMGCANLAQEHNHQKHNQWVAEYEQSVDRLFSWITQYNPAIFFTKNSEGYTPLECAILQQHDTLYPFFVKYQPKLENGCAVTCAYDQNAYFNFASSEHKTISYLQTIFLHFLLKLNSQLHYSNPEAHRVFQQKIFSMFSTFTQEQWEHILKGKNLSQIHSNGQWKALLLMQPALASLLEHHQLQKLVEQNPLPTATHMRL